MQVWKAICLLGMSLHACAAEDLSDDMVMLQQKVEAEQPQGWLPANAEWRQLKGPAIDYEQAEAMKQFAKAKGPAQAESMWARKEWAPQGNRFQNGLEQYWGTHDNAPERSMESTESFRAERSGWDHSNGPTGFRTNKDQEDVPWYNPMGHGAPLAIQDYQNPEPAAQDPKIRQLNAFEERQGKLDALERMSSTRGWGKDYQSQQAAGIWRPQQKHMVHGAEELSASDEYTATSDGTFRGTQGEAAYAAGQAYRRLAKQMANVDAQTHADRQSRFKNDGHLSDTFIDAWQAEEMDRRAHHANMKPEGEELDSMTAGDAGDDEEFMARREEGDRRSDDKRQIPLTAVAAEKAAVRAYMYERSGDRARDEAAAQVRAERQQAEADRNLRENSDMVAERHAAEFRNTLMAKEKYLEQKATDDMLKAESEAAQARELKKQRYIQQLRDEAAGKVQYTEVPKKEVHEVNEEQRAWNARRAPREVGENWNLKDSVRQGIEHWNRNLKESFEENDGSNWATENAEESGPQAPQQRTNPEKLNPPRHVEEAGRKATAAYLNKKHAQAPRDQAPMGREGHSMREV